MSIVNGNVLERTLFANLPSELINVKKNLLVDYGAEFGCFVPDADLVIYKPKTQKVIAIISIKTTLRERIAQTAYWKKKLCESDNTRHIKVLFITPDEDGTLLLLHPAKKGRAIVEVDIDGSFVMSSNKIEETSKVKMFDKFFTELKKIAKAK